MARKNPAGLEMSREAEDAWLAYAKWYYAVSKATNEFMQVVEAPNDRDGSGILDEVGDYVEALRTLHSFAINPRSVDPPILPEDVLPFSFYLDR